MTRNEKATGTRSEARHRLVAAGTFSVVLVLASTVHAQTGAHGFAVTGGTFESASEERFGLIGGGYAYPLMKGRLWVLADLTARTFGEGHLDASGGPSAVIGLGSAWRQRVEPFAEVGPRWGDGGDVWWNVGGGTHVWLARRVGARVEYQYQWMNTVLVDSTFGPGGLIQRTFTDITVHRHLIRLGFSFRRAPS